MSDALSLLATIDALNKEIADERTRYAGIINGLEDRLEEAKFDVESMRDQWEFMKNERDAATSRLDSQRVRFDDIVNEAAMALLKQRSAADYRSTINLLGDLAGEFCTKMGENPPKGGAAALQTAAPVGPAGTKEDANAGSASDSTRNIGDDWHNPDAFLGLDVERLGQNSE